MADPAYRAGLNLYDGSGVQALVERMKADPDALAACRDERARMANDNATCRIFERCHATRNIHTALSNALQQIEGP